MNRKPPPTAVAFAKAAAINEIGVIIQFISISSIALSNTMKITVNQMMKRLTMKIVILVRIRFERLGLRSLVSLLLGISILPGSLCPHNHYVQEKIPTDNA